MAGKKFALKAAPKTANWRKAKPKSGASTFNKQRMVYENTVPTDLRKFSAKTQNVLTLVKSVIIPAGIAGTIVGTPAYGAVTLTLASAVGDASAYSLVYDEFRIDEVEITLYPQVTAGALTTAQGLLVTAIDYDDANTPVSMQQLLNNSTSICIEGGRKMTRTFVPACRAALLGSSAAGTSGQDSVKRGAWTNMAGNASTMFYGLKYGLSGFASTTNYDVVIRTRVSFRGVI